MRVFHLDADLRVTMPTGTADSDTRWNKLFPLGTWSRPGFPGGSLTIDKDFLSTMVSNWQRVGKPARPVDYFHRGESLPDGVANTDKVASGWIEDMQLRVDGLYVAIKWTDDARGLILADKLRFLSPTFSVNAPDRFTGKPQGPTLLGAALLNDPFLEELPRVAASAAPTQAAKPAVPGARMDKVKLCALLGLPADTSDEDVEKHLAAKKAKEMELAAHEAQLKLARDEAGSKLQATQEALKLQAEATKKLEAQVVAMQAKERDGAITVLCRRLVSEGRIVAATQEKVKAYALAMGVEEAEKFFGELPVVVKLGETGVPGASTEVDATKSVQAQLDARIIELRKQSPALKYTEAHRLALNENPGWKSIYLIQSPAKPPPDSTTPSAA